jgi:hypothetical protein
MLQAASADAVCAFFVFLHLLERQPERIAEIGLGHAEHQAAHAHSFSDVGVSRVYSVLWHRAPDPLAAVESRYTTLPCVWKRDDASAALGEAFAVGGDVGDVSVRPRSSCRGRDAFRLLRRELQAGAKNPAYPRAEHQCPS